VHSRQPAGGAGKHVRVWVEQGDRRPDRWRGLLDEVPRAGADVEMSASEVLAKALDDRRGGTPPNRAGHEPKHEWIIDREEEGIVASLAPCTQDRRDPSSPGSSSREPSVRHAELPASPGNTTHDGAPGGNRTCDSAGSRGRFETSVEKGGVGPQWVRDWRGNEGIDRYRRDAKLQVRWHVDLVAHGSETGPIGLGNR